MHTNCVLHSCYITKLLDRNHINTEAEIYEWNSEHFKVIEFIIMKFNSNNSLKYQFLVNSLIASLNDYRISTKPTLFGPLQIREGVYQPTAGFTFTCDGKEVNDHPSLRNYM